VVIPTDVDHARDGLVRRDLLDRVAHRTMLGSLPGPPAALVVATGLSWAVPWTRLLVWVLVITGCTALTWVECRRYRRRRAAGEDIVRWSAGLWCIGANAAAWGSGAVFLYPVDDPELVAVLVIVLSAICSLETLEKAGSRDCYLAATVPIFVLLVLGLVVHERRALPVMLVLVGVFFGLLWSQARDVHRSLVDSVRLRYDHQRLVETLQEQVRHDPLTALANRVGFQEALERALAEHRRGGDGVAVALFDIDRFKTVNDSRGHAAGDAVLIETAARVTASLRGADLLARLAGDEFCVLITGLRRPTDAIDVAQRILDAFAAPFDVGGSSVELTTSVGVATANHTSTPDRMLRDADIAMYRAKADGRNRVEVFDERLRREIDVRRQREMGLRDAIANGQLVTWYQPEVDLSTGEVVGAEALVRWIHPTRGVIPAGEFVAIAEECGMLDALGDLVLAEACNHRRRLADAGIVDQSFRIRCNVSPQQITRPDAAVTLIAAVERSGCHPAGITLEITETAVMRDVDEAIRQLDVLRAFGITVDLDDFGTGYSSLSLLQRLPIDGIKIDRSFVQRVDDSLHDATIVGSIIELAQRLGLGVVAEGVETDQQREELLRLGCANGQGYLWSAAMPFDQFVRWRGHIGTSVASGSP
jgi:diguanylate cyclase (GGDEF)-like protein